jgi:hypothetical protein
LRSTTFLLSTTLLLGAAIACGGSGTRQLPASPSEVDGFNGANLTAPGPDSPSNDQEVDSMRPTLRVVNATSNGSGPRTYDFQIADNQNFSTFAANQGGVAEGTDGKTAYTPPSELAPATRYYWRARAVQGTSTGPWSQPAQFRTKIGGYNRPGELYDPLIQGLTVGTRVGSTTFVPGEGLRLDSETSYLRYELPTTLSSGEFSVEVKGLRANGPGGKLKILSMSSTTGDLVGDPYELSVQYRGVNGNPDNAISYKAVWGSQGIRLEPDLATRAASVVSLDPGRTYFWQASWNPTSFRLVVRDGGPNGGVIYDRTATAPAGTGPYAPSPHYVYLGATSGVFGSDAGSWPGAVFRNVWVGNKPRPAALGNALQP